MGLYGRLSILREIDPHFSKSLTKYGVCMGN
jgi:hypothetical protein